MTAAVPPVSDYVDRSHTQRLMTQLPYDSVPEMIPPSRTILCKAPIGYSRDLETREDAPYFNASAYCNRLNLRFSLWLRHPATIALIQAFNGYYREAAHERAPSLVMVVKGGSRIVHGYYIHMMLHDALSAWCDFESLDPLQRPRLPTAIPRETRPTTTTFVYTTHTTVTPGATAEDIEAAQASGRARMASVITAACNLHRE